ncbi:putative Kazal domain-containing protein [Plasmopara halstedii]
MKLSVTFTFVAVTVTSSSAAASVIDNHHENAIVFQNNTLLCADARCDDDNAPVCGFDNKTYPNACIFQATNCRTNVTIAHLGPCRDKFVDNQRVHSLASATSSNKKTPLVRDRTHLVNEERGSALASKIKIIGLGTGAGDFSELQRVRELLGKKLSNYDLAYEHVHPYVYLKLLHDDWDNWMKRLGRLPELFLRSKKTVKKSPYEPKVITKVKKYLDQIPEESRDRYLTYAKLYNTLYKSM